MNGAWFFEPKRSEDRRGVKEKDQIGAVKDVVSPSVIDESVVKEKQSSLVDTSIPPTGTSSMSELDRTLNDALSRVSKEVISPSVVEDTVTTLTDNVPGKSSYANVTSKLSGKRLNFHTLFTPVGNGIDVVIPVESIRTTSERFANPSYSFLLGKRVAYPVIANYVRNTWGKYGLVHSMFSSSTGLNSFQFSSMERLDAMLENGPCEDGLSAIATKLGTPLMLDSYTADMCMQSWGRSSYARAMIELRADVELKDNIVVVMPKITREGYYTCNIRVEYEWKPPRCACCKVFGNVLEECPKNIGVGSTKNLKKTSPTPKGILVGQKMGFKPKQVFQPVSKKSTTNTCEKKKINSESTKEVSKPNPFEVLTSVDNDVDLGTNGGISNLADKGTINVSSSDTPIGEKINKIERQIREGKLRFVDDDGNPLVPTGIVDSDSEVEVVFDETAN
ncbi:hypothetical protein Tco_0298502 [Tanacetum coccineum]